MAVILNRLTSLSMKKKPKLCAQCQTPFTQRNSLQVVCSVKCAIAYNSKKEVNKRVNEMKKDVQKLSDLRDIARAAFQMWIRKRDEKLPCISCGTMKSEQFDGGHYLKAELYTGLIFNEDNVHKQCCHCNDWLQGNTHEYRKRLIERIGLTRVEALEAKADSSRVYKFTRHELIDIAKDYKNRLKQLNSQHNAGEGIDVTFKL